MKRHPVNRPSTKHATESGLIPENPEELSVEKERLVELLARFLWLSWRDRLSTVLQPAETSSIARNRTAEK